MKRLILAAAAVAAAFLGGSPVLAKSIEAQLDGMVTTCALANDKAWCDAQVKQFRADWPKANKGNYQAQRNVAFCYATSCDGAIMPDLVTACAWRIVIMASPADITSGDVANYRNDCLEKVSGTMRSDARLMAERLFKKIYRKKLDWSDAGL